MQEDTEQARPSTARRWLGTLAFILLAVVVGVVGYQLSTDLLGMWGHRALASELSPELARMWTTPVSELASEPAGLNFTGWEKLDKAYWSSLKEGQAFGRLVAPAMKLDEVVVKGTSRADLMRGPGWILRTDPPGPTGNCGISGHRTTYGAPFRHLDKLKAGDNVTLYSPNGVYTYEVVRLFTVAPTRVDVLKSTEQPILTMTTCDPPYSARRRLIAQSRLTSAQPAAK